MGRDLGVVFKMNQSSVANQNQPQREKLRSPEETDVN